MADRGNTFFILLVTVVQVLFCASIVAQDTVAVTKNEKSPANFICISYQDVYGKNMNSKRKHGFESSVASFGDKKLMQEIILRDILFNNQTHQAGDAYTDSAGYIACLDSVPFIINSRLMSPFLMSLSVMAYSGNTQKIGFYRMLGKYNKIQKETFPHMPGGIANDMPLFQSETDEVNWMKAAGRTWLMNYPLEVSAFMRYYRNLFGQWLAGHPVSKYANPHLDMLLQSVDSAGIGFVNSKIIQENWDVNTEAVTQPAIADSVFMHQHPGEFVKNIYFSLLYRQPTPDEQSFLVQYILAHPKLTPKLLYYAMMNSEEYKFF